MIRGKMTKLGFLAALATVSVATTIPATSGARAADLNTLMATCANCHGKDGASTDPSVPVIGGMSSAYAAENLAAYKSKTRPCPPIEVKSGDKKGTKTDMCEVVKDLSDADIAQIADALSKQPFVPAKQTIDPAVIAKGAPIYKQSCEKCHSQNGNLADDDSGILAGQWVSYMKAQVAEVKSGARKTDKKSKMKETFDGLDDASVDAVLSYFASQGQK